MFFGNDLTILHAGNQFTSYAEGIANYFSKQDFQCLVQQVKDLQFKANSIGHSVTSSSLLIVLATEEATHSDFIEKAISHFIKQNKAIIAIDFGFLADSKWYYLLKNQKKIVEKSSFVQNTDPSNAVIDLIEHTATFRVKNRLLKKSNMMSAVLMLASIFVIIGASYYIYHLSESLKTNMALVEESAQKVVDETERAATANQLANQQQAAAEHFQRVAVANQKAAESANQLASDPTKAMRKAQAGFNHLILEKDSIPTSIHAALVNGFYGSLNNNLGFYTQEVNLSNAVNDFKEISQVRKYLVGNSDGRIRIINQKGEVESNFQAHGGKVTQVTYSGINQFILTTSEDSLAKLFTINGDLIQTLNDHHDEITLGAIAPNGTRLLTATDDTLRIWDIKGNIIGKFSKQDKIVNYAVYSPVEGLIAAAFGNEINVIDFSGNIVTRMINHNDDIVNLSFSVNGSRIVSTSFDSTAVVWAKNGQRIATLTGHNGIVNAAQFSSDRTKIITASDDQTAKLWDWNGKFIKTLAGHTAAVVDASFSPDSKLAITISLDNTIKLWDNKGKLLKTYRGHGNQITKANFSHDGKFIVSSSKDGTIKRWLVFLPLINSMDIHANGVKDVFFLNNDNNMLTISGRGLLRYWDANGKLVNGNVINGKQTTQIVEGDNDQLFALVDGQVVKLNATGSVASVFRPLGNDNALFAVSQGQQLIASLNVQNQLIMYNTLKDTVQTPAIDGFKVNDLAFNNKQLILATDQGLRAVNADGLVEVLGFGDLNIHKILLNDSLSGGMLLTNRGQLISYDASFSIKTRFTTEFGIITTIGLDIKNEIVYAGTKNGNLLVFKHNGELITTIKLHDQQVNKVVVSGDNTKILTASEDNSAKIIPSMFGIDYWLKNSELATFSN